MDPVYRSDCDFTGTGYRSGTLSLIGRSGDEWTVGIHTFSSGPGPRVLLTGALHGDEYEGPIALLKLVERLRTLTVRGRVTVVPVANPGAMAAKTRCTPADGLDLNRNFPGDPAGSPTQQIAHAICDALLPHADIVIDCHTGGTSHAYTPCAMMHPLADANAHRRTLALVRAMRLPAGVVIDESDKPGMFDTHVESLGKPFVCCEFGGGGVSRDTVEIAEAGLGNALIHLGLIDGTSACRNWRGRKEARMLEVPALDFAVGAPVTGLFEPLLELGDSAEAGQTVAVIRSVHDDGPATAIDAPVDGILFTRRARGFIEAGERAVMMARPLAGSPGGGVP